MPLAPQVETGTQAFTLLAAAAATGAGTGVVFASAHQNFGVQVLVTGSPASISVSLQASLDGVNWANVGSAITAAGYTAISSSPATQVRANLTTLSGGTSPTVTVLFCAAS